MTAWKLFTHALGMLWRNLGMAVRVSLVPWLAAIALITLGVLGTAASGGAPGGGQVLIVILLGLVSTLVLTVSAVNWHRAVLLSEPVGWLPRLRTDRIVAYVLRALLLGVAFSAVAFIVFLPFSLLAPHGGAVSLLGMLILCAVAIVLGAIYWRLSASLPGAAIDNGARIGAVWKATEGQTGTLILLTLIVAGAGLVLGIVVAVISHLVPFLGAIANIALNWGGTMFLLSLLTTLYGHYVERRDLI